MVCEQDWSASRLTIRACGNLSRSELVRGVREVTSDARYDDIRHVVVDFLGADAVTDDLLDAVEDLLVVMIGSSASNPNVRVAVLAADTRIFDLVRALNAAPETHRPVLACFADRAPVPDWLADVPRRSFPSMRFRPR